MASTGLGDGGSPRGEEGGASPRGHMQTEPRGAAPQHAITQTLRKSFTLSVGKSPSQEEAEAERAKMQREWERFQSEALQGPSSTIEESDGVGRQPRSSRTSSVESERTILNNQVADATGLRLCKLKATQLVRSEYFDMFFAGVILVNSAQIGVEQAFRLSGKDSAVITASEHVFLAIYVVELCLRLTAGGLQGLRKDHWLKFDFILVVFGVTTDWLLPLAQCVDCTAMFDQVMILRAGRILRLARTLHLLVQLPILWMLVRGLVSSMSTVFYTLITLVCVLYILALLGIELITNNPLASGPDADAEFMELAEEYFPDLAMAMLTLVQFVCMDSIGSIYRPLIRKDWRLCFYFLFVILTVSIALANLITAVVVNRAMEQAEEDREARKVQEVKRKKKIIRDVKRIFTNLDTDNSGMVTWEEIMRAPERDMDILRQLVSLDNPLQIFKMLDVDGSGQVSIDEFCDGIVDAVTSDRHIEFKRMEKHLQSVRQSLKEIHSTSQSPKKASSAAPEEAPGWAQDLIHTVQNQVANEMRELRLEVALLSRRSCGTYSARVEFASDDVQGTTAAAKPVKDGQAPGEALKGLQAKPGGMQAASIPLLQLAETLPSAPDPQLAKPHRSVKAPRPRSPPAPRPEDFSPHLAVEPGSATRSAWRVGVLPEGRGHHT
mmetsp:Transcript_86318/g.239362  ORF Transcript_86318/g.239362 Transcript_86318/m.239362 type:complete len:665 (+) Transcript_86318:51-2045(+)